MDFVALGIIALVAATAQASLGVGYGIILAPVGALITDPETAIATTILTGSVVGIILYAEHRPRSPEERVADEHLVLPLRPEGADHPLADGEIEEQQGPQQKVGLREP